MSEQTDHPNNTMAPSTPTLRMPWWRRWLFCGGSGIMTALIFPPYDWSMLVWVALLPLLTVLWRGPARFWPAFRMGWLYGMGWYCVSFFWITEVGEVFGIPSPIFLSIAFLPLMALYALLPGLWAGLAATWLRPNLSTAPIDALACADKEEKKAGWKQWLVSDMRSGVLSAISLAALWVCIEWLRAHFFCLGFSWCSMGSALYSGYVFAQWAEFIGVTGLSFFPVAFNIIVWGMLRRAYLHQKGMGRCNRPWDFYAAVIVLMAMFMGGLIMTNAYSPAGMQKRNATSRSNPSGEERTYMLPVLAAQINLSQSDRLYDGPLDSYYNRLIDVTVDGYHDILRQTMEKAQQNPELAFTPRLPVWVVWPESALPYRIWRNTATGQLQQDALTNRTLFGPSGLPVVRQILKEELGATPFVLFCGVDEGLLEQSQSSNPLAMPLEDGSWVRPAGMKNSMAIIPQGWESICTVSKQHLMPFGEYVPLADSSESIAKLYAEITGTQVADGIKPGTGDQPVPVPVPGTDRSISVIPAICYEDTVGDLLTRFVRPEPQVIVNISNDAWFRNSACGAQQARMAAFRCIELRRPMVRAANMGVTGCIAANGVPLHELRKGDGSPWMEGYSYAELPVDLSGKITLYARWGDWFTLLCSIGVLAGLICRYLRVLQSKKLSNLSQEAEISA